MAFLTTNLWLLDAGEKSSVSPRTHCDHSLCLGEGQEEQSIMEKLWMSLRPELLPLGADGQVKGVRPGRAYEKGKLGFRANESKQHNDALMASILHRIPPD